METKKLTDTLSVCGQLTPGDMDALCDAGVRTIICNRPDGEGQGQPSAAEVGAAAAAKGITFHHNPVVPDNITPDNVQTQGKLLGEADGKVVAFCGSGKRATALWMLSNPDDLPADELVRCAVEAGYPDLEALRQRLK